MAVVLPDPCITGPCKNSGTCKNDNGNAKCDCTTDFTGDKCETKIQGRENIFLFVILLSLS